MKRISILMIIIALFGFQGFSQIASTTAPKEKPQTAQTSSKAVPGKFVDNNKNGICDNHEGKMQNGKCANFVDKNGDGICDNQKDCCKGKGNAGNCGNGCQHKNGQGKGNCGTGCGNHHRYGCSGQSGSTAPAQQAPTQEKK